MIKKVINLLSEFSVALILGIIAAFVWSNISPETYRLFLDTPLFDSFLIFGHPVTFTFIINDIFMVFFFGIAAVEITQAVLPGGSLNPISKAINPILGTFGGILGPIALFLLLCVFFTVPEGYYNGWAIPTATDIALAWLIARFIFGSKHPAISFLLLLAVGDDAIGLAIIAIAYPDPSHPVQVYWLGLTLLGISIAYLLRRNKVRSFWPYLLLGGVPSWLGLILAYLHPALALVFIVPFMPAILENKTSETSDHARLFEEEKEKTTLFDFEHSFSTFVDFGLLGFGLANAGVELSNFNIITWIILTSLVLGKIIGITLFSSIGHFLGFSLPEGVNFRSLIVISVIAGLGLTVALFVSGVAFTDIGLQDSAKMGALLSIVSIPLAFGLAKVLKVKKADID